MKITTLVAAALIALAPAALPQGSLTPPGPPAPTMKTLDQIEARIIVNAAKTPGNLTNTFIISQPGSYYLTGNITGDTGKHGISIQADDVTLDLNGFALISGVNGLRGVNVPLAESGFCIRNGSVRGWTGGGVQAGAAMTLAEDLRLSNNTGATGLVVGNGSMVKDCVASGNGTGFFGPDRTQFFNCMATVNIGVGFDCTSYVTLTGCTSGRNGGTGIVVQAASSVIRCNAGRNIPLLSGVGGHGILAGVGCTIVDCTVFGNTDYGIQADDGSTIRGCTATSNGGAAGISASFGGAVTNCTARENSGFGIFAVDGVVAFCAASGNNQSNTIPYEDIWAPGSTRTGNNPAQ